MLIGMFAILSLLPLVAVTVLVVKINSNKLHLILLSFIIGMVALIEPLLFFSSKVKEALDPIHGSETGLFVSKMLFIGYLIFILVLSGILFLNVHTNSKAISKPLRIICRLPFAIGMAIFSLFYLGILPLS